MRESPAKIRRRETSVPGSRYFALAESAKRESVKPFNQTAPEPAMVAYVETTDEIEVTVRPVYLDGQSDMMNRRFVFGYFVRIENIGAQEVQLLRRHWFIRDGDGQLREVEGDGVIGIQPIISAGSFHEYNSFCVLGSFEGSMHGTYLMERPSGERFRVNIPRFDLRAAAN